MERDKFNATAIFRQLESNELSFLPAGSMDAISAIRQVRLNQNPWQCDCRASYVASWLRRRFANYANLTDPLRIQRALAATTGNWTAWEFGAGATCTGPGVLGGRYLLHLTFRELCEGQWASMKGIVPRLPLDLIAPSVVSRTAGKDTIPVRIANANDAEFDASCFSKLPRKESTLRSRPPSISP